MALARVLGSSGAATLELANAELGKSQGLSFSIFNLNKFSVVSAQLVRVIFGTRLQCL